MKDSRKISTVTRTNIERLAHAVAVAERFKRERKLKQLQDRPCLFCKESFKQTREWQTFCSPTCRLSYFKVEKEKEVLELHNTIHDLTEENKMLRDRVKELESKE